MSAGRLEEARWRAERMFAAGRGYSSVARALGVRENTARKWALAWRAGRGPRRTYAWGVKVAAARAVVEGGLTKPQAMAEYGVASLTCIDAWCRAYRAAGPDGLLPRPGKAGAGDGTLP